MAQQHLKFGNYTPPDPDQDGYSPAFAVTSSSNSTRTMRGVMKNSTLFTVEAYDLKWTDISAEAVKNLLQEIMGKDSFDFYHYNVYKAQWETGRFNVANINSPFYDLSEGNERADELSFQVTGINPV